MSFLNRLTHSANSTRLVTSGNKEVYQANLTNEPCLVQPLNDQMAISYGLQASKAHRAYFQMSADIQPNDVVTIDSVAYKVHGVKLHRYGNTPHKRVLVEEQS